MNELNNYVPLPENAETNSTSDRLDEESMHPVSEVTDTLTGQTKGKYKTIYKYETEHTPLTVPTEKEVILSRSSDLAWILGTLAAGGGVSKERLSIQTQQIEFLNEFQRRAEAVFQINASRGTYERDDKQYGRLEIHSTSLTATIGEMNHDKWAQTIINKHPWLLQHQGYIWNFLEGFVERRGEACVKEKAVVFNIKDIAAGNLLGSLLNSVGINQIHEIMKGDKTEYQQLYITNKSDLALLAAHLRAINPQLETKLDYLRGIQNIRHPERKKITKPPHNKSSLEGVIAEYSRLKSLLGRPPSSHEIERFKRNGQAQFSVGVYRNLSEDGSWKKGIETIEQIITERQTEKRSVPHTRKSAWILSILSTSATVDLKRHIVLMDQTPIKDLAFLESLKTDIENIFNVKGSIVGKYPHHTLYFNSLDFTKRLGDLHRSRWGKTINEQHSWIVEDEEYMWGFVEGLFDMRGYISSNDRVMFHLANQKENADYLLTLLKHLGIENAWASKSHRINLSRLYDSWYLATHISSRVPTREEKLKRVREALYSDIHRIRTVYTYEDGAPTEATPREKKISPTPSTDLAWMLGILASEGSITHEKVKISSKDSDLLLDSFQQIGEKIFKINATRTTEHGKQKVVNFYNASFITFLGDLRSHDWPNILVEKHPWILHEETFIWKFLEGFFERKGTASKKQSTISFSTGNEDVAIFISSLLNKVGVTNIRSTSQHISGRKVTSIFISNQKEVKIFAEHIRSTNKNKEQQLEKYRNITPPSRLESVEEAVAEISKIYKKLERFPTYEDVMQAYKAGETKYPSWKFITAVGVKKWSEASTIMKSVLNVRSD